MTPMAEFANRQLAGLTQFALSQLSNGFGEGQTHYAQEIQLTHDGAAIADQHIPPRSTNRKAF